MSRVSRAEHSRTETPLLSRSWERAFRVHRREMKLLVKSLRCETQVNPERAEPYVPSLTMPLRQSLLIESCVSVDGVRRLASVGVDVYFY